MQRLRTVTSLDVGAVAGHHAMPAALLFSGLDKPRMLFFLLINVKMPTIVGILTFMSKKNFMLS